MFQVDPSMAGGEAMCPICHGVVVVPAEAFGPPVVDGGPPPAVADAETLDFSRRKRGGMFEGLDTALDAAGSGGQSSAGRSSGGRFAHLVEPTPPVAPPEAPSDVASLVAMACPHCGGAFQVDGSLAGQQAMCPMCRGVVAIPDLGIAATGCSPPETGPPSMPPLTPPPAMPPSLGPMSLGPASPMAAVSAGSVEPPVPSPPAASVQGVLTEHSTLATSQPLAAKVAPGSDVPLSVRQPLSASRAASRSPTTTGMESMPGVETLLPPEIAPSEPAGAKSQRSGKDEPVGKDELAGKDEPVAAQRSDSLSPPSETPPRGSSAPTSSQARSPSAKVDALLPTVADPDEEIVAERPIAVEEPPEDEFPPLIKDSDTDAGVTDADGAPARRLAAAERARLRRIRTLLLFGVGMLILILAAVLLPQMGFVFDLSKK